MTPKIRLHKRGQWFIVLESGDLGPYSTHDDAKAALRELRAANRQPAVTSQTEDAAYAKRSGDLFDVSCFTGPSDDGPQMMLF